MADLAGLLRTFQLEDLGAQGPAALRRWRGTNIDFSGGAVVFGGQLLGQSIMAAAAVDVSKDVKSIHTIFARAGSTATDLDIDVEVLQEGRTFASASVSASQAGRLCSRSLVLLHAPDPDFIHHETPAATSMTPEEAVASDQHPGLWEIRTVGGADISNPEEVGPAELDVWLRFPGAPDDATVNQALLAFASDGFLIGTAMRPHKGVGQSLAHRTIATTVITHTLSFHAPVRACEWMLLRHESPFAGEGRSYGRCLVYSASGALVASFVQENMIRGTA
jgi:acyl-CoA thioesterase II